jgi:hypothetical protein
MADDSALREHLIWLLEGGHAHTGFEDAVKDFPADRQGIRPSGCPYSAWELLEHMRLAQYDMLRFSQSADHVSPEWPKGYWPREPGPARKGDWEKSVAGFRKDLAEFVDLIRNPASNLYEKFPWGSGQTLMREALQIADHNGYHLGQLILVRRLLGIWES